MLHQLVLKVIERPLRGLLIFRIHVPDEERVFQMLRVILEAGHLAYSVVAVSCDCHRV